MRRTLCGALTTVLTAGLLLAGSPAQAKPAAALADAAPSTYTSLSPVRVLDTRNGIGPVIGGTSTTVNLSAQVPANATAVVLNVTGVQPNLATFVAVFPTGTSRPVSSTLNMDPGDIRANQVTVTLGTNRSVNLYNHVGAINLVADLAGYYSTGAGARFTSLPPNRVLDTREAGGPVGPDAVRVLDLVNRIPASATAVTFNLTATNPTGDTVITAWPAGANRPTVSNVNVPPGDTRPNLVTVAVGADRKVNLHNNTGTVDLIADLTGFYTPDYGAMFVPMGPTRVLDTRDGTGAPAGPLGPRETMALDLSARGLPATTTGVVLNITGVDATAPTFVTAWSEDQSYPPPTGSNLNLSAGQTTSNGAVVEVSRSIGVQFYNFAGSVQLIADLAGVFAALDPACTTECVYSWGDNVNRKLGTAEAVPTSPSPARVAGLTGVRAVAGGGSTNGYALRANGTVWAWGENVSGQLGNGWATNYSAGGGSALPAPVVGLAGATAIAAANETGYALRNDGTVWSWGFGSYGQLGNGGTANSTVPVQVSGLTGVVAIAAAGYTAYAVRSNGTVFAWGYNGNGQLGNGSDAQISAVPVPVSGLATVTAVASGGDASYARRADGTVMAWGYNGSGQLGNGQACSSSTPCLSRVPVRVSTLTGVTGIAGGAENGYAVRGDGTAWSWGSNASGELGNGAGCTSFPCESRVPVQVGVADVTQVAGFDAGGYALRSDGEVWAWGYNGFGSLGEDPSEETAQPVRVLGLPDVNGVAGRSYSGYAIVPSA
jgi:alpha-tubulin suppressor-like RCC1 family protein